MTTSTGPTFAVSLSAAALDHEIAELGAPDLEPFRSNRVEVRAARDEGDLLARLCEFRAEIPAHRAGPENRKSHPLDADTEAPKRRNTLEFETNGGPPHGLCRGLHRRRHGHRRSHRRRAARRRRPGRSDRDQRPGLLGRCATELAEAVAVRGNKVVRVGIEPRDSAARARADHRDRRQGRRGRARLQRRARASCQRRPVARSDQPRRRDDARRDQGHHSRVVGGPPRAAVDHRTRLVLPGVQRRHADAAVARLAGARSSRRISSPTTATPAGPTARRSRPPASRAPPRTRPTGSS